MSTSYKSQLPLSPTSFTNNKKQLLQLYNNEKKLNISTELSATKSNFPLIDEMNLTNVNHINHKILCEKNIASNLSVLKKIVQDKKTRGSSKEFKKNKYSKKNKQPYELEKRRNYSNLRRGKDKFISNDTQHKITSMFKHITGLQVNPLRSSSTTHGSKQNESKMIIQHEPSSYSRKTNSKMSKSECFDDKPISVLGLTRQSFKYNDTPKQSNYLKRPRISELGFEKSNKLFNACSKPMYYDQIRSKNQSPNFYPCNKISYAMKNNNRSKSCVKENSNHFLDKEETNENAQNKELVNIENNIHLIKSNFQTPNNHGNSKVISPKILENCIASKHIYFKQGKTVPSTMHTYTNENSTLPTNYVVGKVPNIFSLINELQSVEEMHRILVAMYQREKNLNKENKNEINSKNTDKSLVFFDNDITL